MTVFLVSFERSFPSPSCFEIFSLYGSDTLRAEIIIRAVNSVNVAAPSSKDKSFTNEKSKYFVSNDCIRPVLKIFSFSLKFSRS